VKNDEVFHLYQGVLRKDKGDEDALIAEHALRFPQNHLNKIKRGEDENYRQNLHIMYLHLTRKIQR